MMGSMGHTASHHPCPRSPHVEKRRLCFPPRLILGPQHREALFAVFLVPPHEFQPDFFFRQRRCTDVYVEHRPKPDVLADTLMHHMLMETAAARIGRVGTDRKIMIREHAPGADHFDTLRLISLDQKVISHRGPPWKREAALTVRRQHDIEALGRRLSVRAILVMRRRAPVSSIGSASTRSWATTTSILDL